MSRFAVAAVVGLALSAAVAARADESALRLKDAPEAAGRHEVVQDGGEHVLGELLCRAGLPCEGGDVEAVGAGLSGQGFELGEVA